VLSFLDILALQQPRAFEFERIFITCLADALSMQSSYKRGTFIFYVGKIKSKTSHFQEKLPKWRN
jgi:hypothetical protein